MADCIEWMTRTTLDTSVIDISSSKKDVIHQIMALTKH
uniref:Uncharacterized protein n=1 Tax=Nelumbo nucifera TaxID=4432 RepID=A0A822ZIL3_NELNU|nr:TPA_asm: hypothetical protein HUJ06_003202 [Nelumbo nucifera]